MLPDEHDNNDEQEQVEEKSVPTMYDVLLNELIDDFGIPVSKGLVVPLERSVNVEFGDVIVTISALPTVPRERILNFANAIASLPDMMIQHGIDMQEFTEDFESLVSVLNVLVNLFVRRLGISDADVNITTDHSGNENEEGD